MTKREFKIIVSIRVKDLSPMIGVEVLFEIEINTFVDGWNDETYLESYVMWYILPE